MSLRDPASVLRAVSRLRALCLALPHVPTPAEETRLERFRALVAAPWSATAADAGAIADGWRDWWRDGQTDALLDMAARLPSPVIEGDRRLAAYLAGARTAATADRAVPVRRSTTREFHVEARS